MRGILRDCMSESDDDALLHRLKRLSVQLDLAKQSANQTVTEVARAKETNEKIRKAAAPPSRSSSPRRRRKRPRRQT